MGRLTKVDCDPKLLLQDFYKDELRPVTGREYADQLIDAVVNQPPPPLPVIDNDYSRITTTGKKRTRNSSIMRSDDENKRKHFKE